MSKPYDFSGWATKNNIRCSDGRTIRRNAFKGNDGQTVPLVWNHDHREAANVLGHAVLENREEGVYAYGTFNDTENGQLAKELVHNGDITHMSIFANHLTQNGGDVLHGDIREVSLVLAAANPGAWIDTVIEHSDEDGEAAIIYSGEEITMADYNTELSHADDEDETVGEVFETLSEKQKTAVYVLIGQALEQGKAQGGSGGEVSHADDNDAEDSEETVEDVFNTLSEKQKTAVYAIIGQAIEDIKNEKGNAPEGDNTMKHNAFDSKTTDSEGTLSHSELTQIFEDAKRFGSLKASFEAHNISEIRHADEDEEHPYGITNLDILFPDAQFVRNQPDYVRRDTSWVGNFMNAAHHSAFSRVKSMYADLTEDEARARGYIKGNRKWEEVFTLAKRSTDPQTVYKKQKIDRDDVIDITSLDVVALLKGEMRGMLDEEIARAALVGDGRSNASEDKISPLHIRPIWTDDDIYTIKTGINVTDATGEAQLAKEFITQVIKSRKNYKGSGNPRLYTTEDMLTSCLLLEDNNGRDLYDTEEKLRTKLRVSQIITVPIMENQTRTVGSKTHTLLGLIVNPTDYTFGSDKGGAVSMFDDFDIDYNQMKYLIETRCSGALTKPYSAIAIESVKPTTT